MLPLHDSFGAGRILRYSRVNFLLIGLVWRYILTIGESAIVGRFIVTVRRKRIRNARVLWFDESIFNGIEEALTILSDISILCKEKRATYLPCKHTL